LSFFHSTRPREGPGQGSAANPFPEVWDYPDAYDPGDPGDPYDNDLSAADRAAEEGSERDSTYGAQRTNRSARAPGWLQDSYDEGYEEGRARTEEDP